MPITVSHALSATTPDNPAYEIRPSHWNSNHNATISATAASEIFGAFSNDPAYNVSFSTNAGSKVVASANVTAAPSPVNVTGNGSSVNAQTIAFTNSNGLTLGVSTAANAATITGSYTVPSTVGLISAVNISAGTTSNNLSAVTWSNSNGLTFGLNASTITASYNSTQFAGTGTTFAGTNASASITLNSAGFNMALSAAAAGGVTTGADYIAGNTTGQSSSSTYPLSSFNVSAAGLVSVGWSSNSLIISAPNTAALSAFSGGMSTGGNTSGNTGLVTGQLVLAGGNNITLSGSTNAGSMTVTVSAPNDIANSIGVSTGGNTSGNTGTQTGQVVFAGGNNITLSVATGAAGAQTITISGANQGGVQTGISSIAASGGTQTVGMVSFINSNGLTFGMSTGANTGSITASYTVPATAGLISGINVSATGGTSNNLSGLTFKDSNGVSFGLSTGASVGTLTASVAAQTNQAGSIYGIGNTSGTSSGTYDARTLSISAAGALTVAASNSGWILSAPATSSIVGAGAISVSTNGSTISVSQNTGVTFSSSTTYAGTLSTNGVSLVIPYLTRSINGFNGPNFTAISAPGNASMSFVYWPCQIPVTASRVDALMGWSGSSSATANTCAIAMSVYAAIYTKNVASLSSLSSGSTQTTYSYASNSAGHTEFLTAAIRPLSVPVNINMMPGEYFVGFNWVTATSSIGTATTNLGQTFSIYGGNQLQTASNYAEIGSQTNASANLLAGMGVYSAASTGMPAALSISGIVGTGASLSQANIAVVLRNA